MRVLYLSHVSWNWTKQRPQFLAEALSKYNDITYVYKRPYKKDSLSNKPSLPIIQLSRLPLSRFGFVRYLNNCLYKIQLYAQCLKADVIWFSSPQMYHCIPAHFFKSKITVYDCMDDMIELYPLDKMMKDNERSLYENSSIVLASSSYLADKLKSRYNSREIVVVNNAVSGSFENLNEVLPERVLKFYKEETTTITYVGSISSWMDFDLLKSIHNEFPQININLWGPVHGAKFPEDSGINLCGSIEHKFVSGILRKSDILIMPFVVNELIRSVNPVKLYEYIYSGKPCIAPKYGESLQFGDFVQLYETRDECISMIYKILKGEKKQKSLGECRSFVNNNTWERRVEVIQLVIDNMFSQKS